MRRVIRAKLTPPNLHGHVVERPRVEAHLAGSVHEAAVVWVCATAGAGKTTAVLRAAARDPRQLRWLTVDATDRAPGRLLTYLEAALAPEPGATGDSRRAAADERLAHAEVAGLLAEALMDEPVVVVLDELEHLAHGDAALAGHRLVRAVRARRCDRRAREPRGDRCPRGPGVRRPCRGGRARVHRGRGRGRPERRGPRDADAASVLEATGGWVAGVMFEAWRSDAHVLGSGGESDPFYGYLSHEILDRLSAGEREFLVRASLVDEITPEVAAVIGADDGPSVMAALRDKHLPAVWSADGSSLRLHTRFREYLRELLSRRGAAAIGPLRRRVACMWIEQGHDEEAVEELLLAGAEEDAVAPAERAIPQLIQRLDLEHADRWLAAFTRAGVELTPPLWRAALMSATGQWHFPRGAAIADQLRSPEGAAVLGGLGWEMVALLAWCYHHVARHDDVHALIREHPGTPELQVAGRLFDAVCAADVRWVPPPTVEGPLDVVRIRAHFVRGEMAQVRELATSRWSASLSVPFTVSRLRASGRTSEALAVYEASASSGSTDVWLHAIAYPEILIDLRRTEDALAALVEGRRMIDRTGSRMLALLNEVLRAKHAIRLRDDPALALEILEPLGLARRGGIRLPRGGGRVLARPGAAHARPRRRGAVGARALCRAHAARRTGPRAPDGGGLPRRGAVARWGRRGRRRGCGARARRMRLPRVPAHAAAGVDGSPSGAHAMHGRRASRRLGVARGQPPARAAARATRPPVRPPHRAAGVRRGPAARRRSGGATPDREELRAPGAPRRPSWPQKRDASISWTRSSTDATTPRRARTCARRSSISARRSRRRMR